MDLADRVDANDHNVNALERGDRRGLHPTSSRAASRPHPTCAW